MSDTTDARGAVSAPSRRAVLGAIGLGAATAAAVSVAGATGASAALRHGPHHGRDGHGGRGPGQGAGRDAAARVSFYGPHQAGITTPIQENLVFASLRVTTGSRAELINLLRMWSLAAYVMTTGRPIGETGAVNGAMDEAPEDTGEALDIPPSNLTVTLGFGPTLFRDADGSDRFGIAARTPKRFSALPSFPNDVNDPAISGGDICIQACADDLQVALHAMRNLVRLSDGAVSVAWSQIGFGKSAQYAADGKTGRNLFGFKDGTNNIAANDERGFDQSVWVQPSDGQGWMTGGTFLAVRKIRMLLEVWDESPLDEQQEVFGRTKSTGAPLSGGGEFTRPDFAKTDASGNPVIPPHSHMALASPANNGGTRILRRAFNYLDGTGAEGLIDSGLFFLGYVRDLERQFIPMQRKLSELDLMNEYVRYTSSSAFAIPPGARTPKDYVGQGLFA